MYLIIISPPQGKTGIIAIWHFLRRAKKLFKACMNLVLLSGQYWYKCSVSFSRQDWYKWTLNICGQDWYQCTIHYKIHLFVLYSALIPVLPGIVEGSLIPVLTGNRHTALIPVLLGNCGHFSYGSFYILANISVNFEIIQT